MNLTKNLRDKSNWAKKIKVKTFVGVMYYLLSQILLKLLNIRYILLPFLPLLPPRHFRIKFTFSKKLYQSSQLINNKIHYIYNQNYLNFIFYEQVQAS